jgi:hypothetical protein
VFEKKLAATALVLADEGDLHPSLNDVDRHGTSWEKHKYVLEVRPEGGTPFRVETKCRVPTMSSPDPGDLVNVLYAPKDHSTEMVIEGDARYDPKVRRAKREEERRQQVASAQALLHGANPDDLGKNAALTGDPDLDELVELEARQQSRDPRELWEMATNGQHETRKARRAALTECPECRALVDQSAPSTAMPPVCPRCGKPLPCPPA